MQKRTDMSQRANRTVMVVAVTWQTLMIIITSARRMTITQRILLNVFTSKSRSPTWAHVQRKQRLHCQAVRICSATELHHTLHWLPMKQRVDYKPAVLTYKARQSGSPLYLAIHTSAISFTEILLDKQLLTRLSSWLTDWLSFYVPHDTKKSFWIRSSKSISWLSTEKQNLKQQRQTWIHNKIYYSTK